jgi:hypothetical protein
MSDKKTPDKQYLWECFDYDEQAGLLFWKERPRSHFEGISCGNRIMAQNVSIAGRPALNTIKKNGYRSGSLDGRYYTAHRVIWKMMTGEEPVVIDHINGDGTDNRIVNLRSVTATINARNMARPIPKSGCIGVYAHQNGGWGAQITVQGRVLSHYNKDYGSAVRWRKMMEAEHGYIIR